MNSCPPTRGFCGPTIKAGRQWLGAILGHLLLLHVNSVHPKSPQFILPTSLGNSNVSRNGVVRLVSLLPLPGLVNNSVIAHPNLDKVIQGKP